MDEDAYKAELQACIDKILASTSLKKLIVAGPGTGKTHFFRTLISKLGGDKKEHLVLTFINELEKELEKDLGDIAHVSTFHGYCRFLLKSEDSLRAGLNANFEYYPPLFKVIKSDWEISKSTEAPDFIDLMRSITLDERMEFFIKRGNHYNAVGFEDSIFRVHLSLLGEAKFEKTYTQIIVDEYQDFNQLEVDVLAQYIEHNPALIVGDDDQALYCVLRGSDPTFIRDLHKAGKFEIFSLPFCLRCPKSVITVFKSILENAKAKGYLKSRIDKRFDFFPPIKGKDSEIYPNVKLIKTTIQQKKPVCNYFGRYILQEIQKIPKEEIKESHEKGFPTILIIGPTHFLKSITPLFDQEGYGYEIRDKHHEVEIDLIDAIRMLKRDRESELGWRIILEIYKQKVSKEVLSKIMKDEVKIIDSLPKEIIDGISKKIESFTEITEADEKKIEIDLSKPRIKLTTYEGAKGLSAQQVFIVGFQNGSLPFNPKSISDIEICKLLVALTRARKQCHILTTRNFGGKWIQFSEFINWLGKECISELNIDKNYWT